MEAIEQIGQALSKGLPNVYLWHGEERFFVQEALKVIKSHFLAQDPSGSCIETVTAKSVTPSQIVEIANTVSFFGPKLLIVEDIPYFLEGQGDSLDIFYDYFSNPNPAACCVFIAQGVHRSRKIYKAFERAGQILEFSAPKRTQEWLAWLDRELLKRGKTMSPQVKSFFLEWSGHHPGVISSELDKLVVYMGERKGIQVGDIKELVPQAVEATVFELTDAVASSSAALALEKLRQVLRGEAPLKVLTMLTRQVRLLLGVMAMRRQGQSLEDAPRVLGIKPFEAQKLWQKSARFNWEQLARALEECLETDVAIKVGKGGPEFLLEIMVVKLCTL